MSMPIKCFECGRIISHLHSKYIKLMKEKKENKKGEDIEDNSDIVKKLGLDDRYCCIIHIQTYPENIANYI